jgi:hypothetical protein
MFHPDEFKVAEVEMYATTYAIYQLVEQLEYEKRIAVSYLVRYPSAFDFKASNEFRDFVSFNTEESDDEAAGEAMDEAFAEFTVNRESIESQQLYSIEKLFLARWEIDDARANKDSSVDFCFWVPDGDAVEVCKTITGSAPYIWSAFVKDVVLQ